MAPAPEPRPEPTTPAARPWPPITGDALPLAPPRAAAAHAPADEAGRPWTVLVEHGRVVGRYRAEDAHHAGTDATRINLGGTQVDVYEVDARESLPPAVGEQVDPVRLGWVKAG